MRKIRDRLTYANVMSTIAVFLAFGGTAYAAATIGSADIQNNAVLSKHIEGGAVRSGELARHAVRQVKIAPDAVTGGKVADGSLGFADLGIETLQISASMPGTTPGACVHTEVAVPGMGQDESLLAFTLTGWDNRLTVVGVESRDGIVMVSACNNTTATTLGAGTGGPLMLLRI